jgi:uncharacterized NTF2-like protein DUF6841
MRATSVFTMIVLLAYPEVASVQGPASFGPSERAAIERLFDGYGKAFSDENYGKLREYLQAPFVRFGPSNTFTDTDSADWVVLQAMDDVIDFFRAGRNALKTQGVDVRPDWGQTRVTVLSVDRALVNRTYRRRRKDGSLVTEAASVYVVSRSSGSWKICGIMNQDLPEFGKVY